MQQETHRARLLGLAHRLLHLAEDLRLAQHHGVQTAGDAESVFHRLLLRETIDVGFDIVGRQLVVIRQPADRLRRRTGAAIDLGTVTGGQDGGFLGSAVANQIAQSVLHRLDAERKLLAHV